VLVDVLEPAVMELVEDVQRELEVLPEDTVVGGDPRQVEIAGWFPKGVDQGLTQRPSGGG
jgi:hypothetical protein